MYLDGLVIRTHPDVKLIRSMSPYLEEFGPVCPFLNLSKTSTNGRIESIANQKQLQILGFYTPETMYY